MEKHNLFLSVCSKAVEMCFCSFRRDFVCCKYRTILLSQIIIQQSHQPHIFPKPPNKRSRRDYHKEYHIFFFLYRFNACHFFFIFYLLHFFSLYLQLKQRRVPAALFKDTEQIKKKICDELYLTIN